MATGLSALAAAASEATSRPSPPFVDTPFADTTNGGTGGSSVGHFPSEEDEEDEEIDLDEDSSDDDLEKKSSKKGKAPPPRSANMTKICIICSLRQVGLLLDGIEAQWLIWKSLSHVLSRQ